MALGTPQRAGKCLEGFSEQQKWSLLLCGWTAFVGIATIMLSNGLSGCSQVDFPLMLIGPFLALFSVGYLTTAFCVNYFFGPVLSATWLVVLVLDAILISTLAQPPCPFVRTRQDLVMFVLCTTLPFIILSFYLLYRSRSQTFLDSTYVPTGAECQTLLL